MWYEYWYINLIKSYEEIKLSEKTKELILFYMIYIYSGIFFTYCSQILVIIVMRKKINLLFCIQNMLILLNRSKVGT
jgi:hypothetical protein